MKALNAVRRVLNVGLWELRQGTKRALAAGETYGLLTAVALAERVRVTWRRLLRKRPRLVWGPRAIINIKYWSGAMRARGWESQTAVLYQTRIAKHEDFDAYRDEITAASRLPERLKQYAFFIWALRRGDVHVTNFDGGFLFLTPLAFKEHVFRQLAGKKLVAYPFGSDIALVGHMGKWEQAWRDDYPELIEAADLIERWVRYTTDEADAAIRMKQVGFVPDPDVEWAGGLAIDTAQWQGTQPPSPNDGRNGPVSILHAPNHRALKGTEFLERAVEKLRGEGLQVDLDLLERKSNEEIREAMQRTDIAGDQFTGGGYAMFAAEAMALGKPVLSGISGDPHFTPHLVELGCPVVDTDVDRLEADLRRLVTDPALRRQLGEAGRAYVERYHSYAAVAADWEAMIDFAWRGTQLPPHLRPS